jgi:hypothetical protein
MSFYVFASFSGTALQGLQFWDGMKYYLNKNKADPLKTALSFHSF